MPRHRTNRIAALLGTAVLLLITGVQMAQAAGRANVVIERVNYKGWVDAYRLTNGTVEVIVVPSVGGRIMRYAYVGGPNVFWENPTVAGKPIPLGTWTNTGGDKIWPWPQDIWESVSGRGWPPPAASDQAPFGAEVIAPDTLRLTSSPVIPWGMRIVRDIRLAREGTQVYTSNRFVQTRNGSFPVAVWTITQIMATPLVFARLTPAADALENGVKPMGLVNFTLSRQVPGVLQAARKPDKSGKFGTEADLLAGMVNGDTLLTLRFDSSPPADNSGATYEPGERAQVYSQPDDARALAMGIAPYIELELTGPRKTLKRGETLTMSLTWELRRLPQDQRTPAAIAATLLK